MLLRVFEDGTGKGYVYQCKVFTVAMEERSSLQSRTLFNGKILTTKIGSKLTRCTAPQVTGSFC